MAAGSELCADRFYRGLGKGHWWLDEVRLEVISTQVCVLALKSLLMYLGFWELRWLGQQVKPYKF